MSEPKQIHLRIVKSNVTIRGEDTVIFANFDDGSIGTIAFDARVGSNLIDKIQDRYYGSVRSVPALDVTDLGMHRARSGDIVLAVKTAQAGELFLSLPIQAAHDIHQLLDDPGALPLIEDEPPKN